MAITTEEEDQKLKRPTSANLCKYVIKAQNPHQWRSQPKRKTKLNLQYLNQLAPTKNPLIRETPNQLKEMIEMGTFNHPPSPHFV
jgi:hypothetical protein